MANSHLKTIVNFVPFFQLLQQPVFFNFGTCKTAPPTGNLFKNEPAQQAHRVAFRTDGGISLGDVFQVRLQRHAGAVFFLLRGRHGFSGWPHRALAQAHHQLRHSDGPARGQNHDLLGVRGVRGKHAPESERAGESRRVDGGHHRRTRTGHHRAAPAGRVKKHRARGGTLRETQDHFADRDHHRIARGGCVRGMAGGVEEFFCTVDAGVCGNHAVDHRRPDGDVGNHLSLAQPRAVSGRCVRGKAPNSKLQHPEKHQTPNFKQTCVARLVLGVCSFFGVWMLALGAYFFGSGSVSPELAG